jgi:hypothetical protein
MLNFFKNINNSKLLVIAILLAIIAFPFDFKWFLKNESLFLGLRLISFVLFVYVIIKVINNKTKRTPKKK